MRSLLVRRVVIAVAVVAAATASTTSPFAQQQNQPRSVFRARLNVVSVDVIVRDRSGAVVRGLSAADFEIREDGKLQDISNFSFEEVSDKNVPALKSADLLAGVEARLAEDSKRTASPAAAPAAAPEAPTPMTSDMLAGRRLITLVFDVSSMQPEDVQRAVDSAKKYVDQQMSPADMVAVATVGSTLTVLTDFTADREKVSAALGTLAFTDGTATEAPAASTAATDEAAADATDDTATETAELDLFNNDVRLRALKTIAESLSAIEHIGLGHYKADPKHPYGDVVTIARVRDWLKPGGWCYFDVPYDPRGYRVSTTEYRAYDDAAIVDRFGPDVEVLGFTTHQVDGWIEKPTKPAGPPRHFYYVALLLRRPA